MREYDETTAVQLHVLLTACDISISLSTIVRSRSQHGCTFRGSKYSQLISRKQEYAFSMGKSGGLVVLLA